MTNVINFWGTRDLLPNTFLNEASRRGDELVATTWKTFPKDEMVVIGSAGAHSFLEEVDEIPSLYEKAVRRPLVYVVDGPFYALEHPAIMDFVASIVYTGDVLGLARALCPRQLTDDWDSIFAKANVLNHHEEMSEYSFTDFDLIMNSEEMMHADFCDSCKIRRQNAMREAAIEAHFFGEFDGFNVDIAGLARLAGIDPDVLKKEIESGVNSTKEAFLAAKAQGKLGAVFVADKIRHGGMVKFPGLQSFVDLLGKLTKKDPPSEPPTPPTE